MKVKIGNKQTNAYSQRSRSSTIIETIHFGDVIELDESSQHEGETWTDVCLSEDKHGYIPGVVNTFPANRYPVRVPIEGDDFKVRFPDLCVVCGSRKHTSKWLHYKDASKGYKRPSGLVNFSWGIPYCFEHAKVAYPLIKQESMTIWVIRKIIAGLMAVFVGWAVNYSRDIFGLQLKDPIQILLWVIVLGGGAFELTDISLKGLFSAIRRWTDARKKRGTAGILGVKVSRAPEGDALLFLFQNEGFAKTFEELNLGK